MQSISKFSLALIAVVAFGASSARSDAPLRQDQSVAFLDLSVRTISDITGADPSDDTTPLYVYDHGCPTGTTPVVAPDGHQLTWGEWNDVSGNVSAKCINKGSHIVVHLSGLIPNAQYSAWVIAFKPPGFDPAGANPVLANGITAGPLGLQDGSQNGFRSDENGDGNISGILPAGDQSLLHLVTFDGCVADYVEFHVHIIYHIDGMTHGPVHGPPCSWVVQRIFRFFP